ncbi:50S ribosomal protein L15 [Candidatus Microgenomates bacterium]|nr:50S ribosomal protein L15 [Candidatus Microgenomates bacterium]
MIKLNQLTKTTSSRKKRLGQGHGSGKGKTGGRGTKGQRSRGKISMSLREFGVSFTRRLPLYRGKYRNKRVGTKDLAVNLKYLNVFPANSVIDKESLIKKNIISKNAKDYRIKILGDGELNIPLTVKMPCSKKAAEKIIAAGGKVGK